MCTPSAMARPLGGLTLCLSSVLCSCAAALPACVRCGEPRLWPLWAGMLTLVVCSLLSITVPHFILEGFVMLAGCVLLGTS